MARDAHDDSRFRGLDPVRAIAELSPDILSVMDAEGRLLYNSPAAERIHGWRVSDMIGRSTMEYIHPDDQAAVQAAFARLFSAPSEPVLVRYRYLHRDGRWTSMEATGRNLLDDPRVNGIIAVSRDLGASRVEPPDAPSEGVRLSDRTYDRARRVVVTVAGEEALSPTESRLLEHLLARPGQFHSIDELLRDVWGFTASVRSRTVYATIDRLRKKLEPDPAHPRHIASRSGLGYAFIP